MWVFELTNNPNLGENIKLEKDTYYYEFYVFKKILKLKKTWNAT